MFDQYPFSAEKAEENARTKPTLHPEFETGFRLDETPWEHLYEHETMSGGEQPDVSPDDGPQHAEVHPGEDTPPDEIYPENEDVPPEIPVRDPQLVSDDPEVTPFGDEVERDYEDWQPPGSEKDGSIPL